MLPNKESKAIRQAKLIEKKLIHGKTLEQAAEELGVHKSTAGRDWKELRQDATLSEYLESLKLGALLNAVSAQDVEGQFIVQIQGKDELSTTEVQTANTIKVSSQKMYSFLAGENAKKDGGEKRIEIINFSDIINETSL